MALKFGNRPFSISGFSRSHVISFSSINTQLNETVAIVGAVLRPGAYPYKEGMRVSDLVKAAGSFVLDASLGGVVCPVPDTENASEPALVEIVT